MVGKIVVIVSLITLKLFAVPGDILFSDDFERTSLDPQWTTSNANNAGISTQTSNSGTRSMYTRYGAVSVTSQTINLAVSGAKVEMWIRRGSDSFSEDPDATEDLVVEYLDNTSTWNQISTYTGDGTPGEIYNLSYQLPSDALYNNFQLRIRQTGGSGSGWDYWHVDDVVITETGYVAPPPPLVVGQCDEFEGDLSNWVVSSTTRVNITTATYNSPTHSLSINGGNVDATSIAIDTTSNFKEETFAGSGTDGQIYDRTYSMPADAKHSNFKIRLRMTGGSGNGWDYWHVDDVCLVPVTYMKVTKNSCVINDPVNNATNPKRIPGATIRYAIELENITDFDTDNNIVTDTVDNNFDVTTIRNLQIVSSPCDCIGLL